jgi:hypothetical protein
VARDGEVVPAYQAPPDAQVAAVAARDGGAVALIARVGGLALVPIAAPGPSP